MAKALKIGALVVGVAALAITGVGLAAGLSLAAATSFGVGGIAASTLFLVSGGLSLASSLLAPKPKAPTVSTAVNDRLTVSIDVRTPRKIVFGQTALATDLRDQEYSADQTYLHRFVVVASHRINDVIAIFFDDKVAWNQSQGVVGEYVGYLDVQVVTEGSAANAINIGPRMGSSRRYTGCAYIYFRYRLTGLQKDKESPFAQSIPTRVTIRGRGALVCDPRAGQSPVDQTTWAWTDQAGRNPALQTLWYLLGWRIQNPATGEWKLVLGKGIPVDRINIDSFITAANLCDEPVLKADGSTEPRYQSDGIFSEGDDPSLVLDNLKAAMNAVLDDVDGKIRITVLHNDLGAPVGSLSEADVEGEFRWEQTPPLNETFNVVRGSFTDPSDTALYQQNEYPEVRLDSPDGIERVETINLPLVQSASQAQRLAKQRLARMLYSGTFSATFLQTAWKFQKGDVIRFTFRPLGWVDKLFRIVDAAVQVDGLVPMMLRAEHPDIYLWDASEEAEVRSVEPTTYNAALDPVRRRLVLLANAVERGLFDLATEYSEGNVASLEDGSRWLYVGVAPSTGQRPSDDSTVWSLLQGPVTVIPPDTVIGGELDQDGNINGGVTAANLAGNPEFLESWIGTGQLTGEQKQVLLADVANVVAGIAAYAERGIIYGVSLDDRTYYSAIVKVYADYVAALPNINNPAVITPVNAGELLAKRTDAYRAMDRLALIVQQRIDLQGWKPPEQTNVGGGVTTDNGGYSGVVPVTETTVQVIASNMARDDQMQGKITVKPTARVIFGISSDATAVTGATSIQYGLEYAQDGADWKVYRFTAGVRGAPVDVRADGTVDTFNDGVQLDVHYLRGLLGRSARGDLNRLVGGVTLGWEEIDAGTFYMKAILFPGASYANWRWNNQTTLETVDRVIKDNAAATLEEASGGANIVTPSQVFFTRGTQPNAAGEFTFIGGGDYLVISGSSDNARRMINGATHISVDIAAVAKTAPNATGSASLYVGFFDPTGQKVGSDYAVPIPITAARGVADVVAVPPNQGITSIRVRQQLDTLSGGQVKMKPAFMRLETKAVLAGLVLPTGADSDQLPAYYYERYLNAPPVKEIKLARVIELPVVVPAPATGQPEDMVTVTTEVSSFTYDLAGGGTQTSFTIYQHTTYKGVAYERFHRKTEPAAGAPAFTGWGNGAAGSQWVAQVSANRPARVSFDPDNTEIEYGDPDGVLRPVTAPEVVTALGTPGENMLINPNFKLGFAGMVATSGSTGDWSLVVRGGVRTLERSTATATNLELRCGPFDVTAVDALTLSAQRDYAGVSTDTSSGASTLAAIEWRAGDGTVQGRDYLPGGIGFVRRSVSAAKPAVNTATAHIVLRSGVLAAGQYSRFQNIKLEKGLSATQFVENSADITGRVVVTLDDIEPVQARTYPDGSQPVAQFPFTRAVTVRIGGLTGGENAIFAFTAGPGVAMTTDRNVVTISALSVLSSFFDVEVQLGDARVTKRVPVEQLIVTKPVDPEATTETVTDNSFQVTNASAMAQIAGPLTVRADAQGRVRAILAAGWRVEPNGDPLPGEPPSGAWDEYALALYTGLRFAWKVKTSTGGQYQALHAEMGSLDNQLGPAAHIKTYGRAVNDPYLFFEVAGSFGSSLIFDGFQPGQTLIFGLFARRVDLQRLTPNAGYPPAPATDIRQYTTQIATVTNDVDGA